MQEMVERIRAADPYGALHIVIDDLNLDDDSILSCLADKNITNDEAALARDLLKLSDENRDAVFMEAQHLTIGMLYPSGPF